MKAVTKKIKWVSHLLPKCDICAKAQLCMLLEGLARECDVPTDERTHAHMYASQVKIMQTLALLSWRQGLSSAIFLIFPSQLFVKLKKS